jgi:hypothetical protein
MYTLEPLWGREKERVRANFLKVGYVNCKQNDMQMIPPYPT